MNALGVAGVGVVGPFGVGLSALVAGVACVGEEVPHPDGASSLVCRADTAEIREHYGARVTRRLDGFSRIGLLAAHLAITDAGLVAPLGERTALVTATGYGASGSTFGFMDSIIEGGDQLNSPTHFSNSVHNSATATVSMTLGITGPNSTVSQLDNSLTSGFLSALGIMGEQGVDRLIFGALDEFAKPYALGLDKLWGRPKHGEGAVFFVLEPPKPGGVCLELFEGAGGQSDFARSVGRFPVADAFELALGVLKLRRGEGSGASVAEPGGYGVRARIFDE